MIYLIGFLAQICFSGRLLFQWIMSEKAKQVVSPTIFWLLSLLGSYLLFFYGWLRNDFAIILGQLISYYIYIWNLDIKNSWKKIPRLFRYFLISTPFFAIGYMLNEVQDFINQFFNNESIPLWLIIFGSLGQIIFTLRFVYQWIYSQKRHQSILPLGFWLISLTGSIIIVSYAFVRRDPVLILGQSTGLIVYSRNIWILYQSKKL
ncbi:MAG: lipid-A-disaccharide synthase N-terminal domain-containing protein [Odoribacter sp.]